MFSINLDLYFKSGSVLIFKENETIFCIACDKLNNDVNFEIVLEHPSKYMYAFLALYSTMVSDVPIITKERQDYHLWLEYELLKRVEEISSIGKETNETELEDYLTIKSRREDLAIRVRSQMAHMDKVKHKIPLIKKRQKLLWKNYSHPYLTNIGNLFSLHIFLEDRYTVLNITGDKLPYYCGFTEFSIPFYESFDIFDHHSMKLTNVNPNLKGLNPSIKSIELDINAIRNYHYSQFLLFLQRKNNLGKEIELNRVEFFDLLIKIRNYFPSKILNFTLRGKSEKRGSIITKGDSLEMILVRENTVLIQFKIPVDLLQSMNKVLPFVKTIKFQQSFLGLIIHLDCEGFTITKTNIPASSHLLYTVLYEKFRNQNKSEKYTIENDFLSLSNIDGQVLDNISPDILQGILEGAIGYNYENNCIFLNSNYTFPIQQQLNVGAFELGTLIGEKIQKSRYHYKLELGGHCVDIKIGKQLSWNCTCGKDCIYLLALLAILLEDKNYE